MATGVGDQVEGRFTTDEGINRHPVAAVPPDLGDRYVAWRRVDKRARPAWLEGVTQKQSAE